MKNLLFTQIFIALLCGCTQPHRKPITNVEAPLTAEKWSNGDIHPRRIYASRIFPEEIMDMSLSIERREDMGLPYIFQQLLPSQIKGREELDYDPYKLKTSSDNFSSELFQSFTNSLSSSDTIFVMERINKDQSYKMFLWKDPRQIKYVTEIGEIFDVQKPKYNDDDFREVFYISSWRKRELQEYGCCEQHEGYFNSNPYSVCVTRIIRNEDSLKIAMFKYYCPLWPDQR